MAVAVVAHLDIARARLVISRAGGALRDPWCIRSGSLTGFSGGCHCVRCGSNFEILSCKYLGMDVVTTAYRQLTLGATPAGSISRGVLNLHTLFQLWWGVFFVSRGRRTVALFRAPPPLALRSGSRLLCSVSVYVFRYPFSVWRWPRRRRALRV